MAENKGIIKNSHGLLSLKDNIHTILYGKNCEKEKLKGQFFYIADTPQYMKEIGLTGDYFSIRYGVITRHKNKDEDHNLSEQNWINLCKKTTTPFAITKSENTFRLYTDVQINNKYIVACVSIKNIRKNQNINTITTVFGYKKRPITRELLYKVKKITPEQAALLDKPNAMSLPPVQRLTVKHSVQLK